jgi:histidinol-phosphate aminotransferase
MYDLLKTIMIENLQLDADGVYPGAGLEDAGLDSLSIVDLSTLLNERYGIPITDAELFELTTLAEIVSLMEQRTTAAA